MTPSDTIFALSSGHGVAGVAVLRLSGPAALDALYALAGRQDFKTRTATLVCLRDPSGGALLDKALTLVFRAPASFTGEDIVELHTHGGPAVVTGVLEALANLPGLRAAEAGEFTRRAFEHGKMDLTEAEGLGDLLHAQTQAQRSQALAQMDGTLRRLYEGWRSRLVGHLAHLEADIDFPDEDLPEGMAGAVAPAVAQLAADMRDHLADNHRGERLRGGYRIVILGAPNVGKSTLMNHLARSDVAIVSGEAGTTRDSIEVQLNLGGFPVRLIDTAGVRSKDIGEVEAEGIRRSLQRAEEADLRLILAPADATMLDPETEALLTPGSMLLFTKGDIGTRPTGIRSKHDLAGIYVISVKTGAGMEAFLAALAAHVRDAVAPREAPALTRIRHRKALEACVAHLERFAANAGQDAVLVAEDIRMASRALGTITGRIDVEDILDVVFSDFCIGK